MMDEFGKAVALAAYCVFVGNDGSVTIDWDRVEEQAKSFPYSSDPMAAWSRALIAVRDGKALAK